MTELIATLPQIDAAQADRRNRVLGALNGWTVGDRVIRARIVGPPATLRGWILCGNGAAIGLDLLDREPCAALGVDGVDGVAVAQTIERFEPVLLVIERALGITLDPERIDAGPVARGLPIELVTLDAHDDVVDRLWLIVPPAIELLTVSASFAPSLAAHVAVEVQLRFPGPRLSPVDAAALSAGDLVLIGGGSFDAVLHSAGVAPCRGRFDPVARAFTTMGHSQGARNDG